MKSIYTRNSLLVVIAAGLVLLGASLLYAGDKKPSRKPVAQNASAQKKIDPAQFAGTESCQGCHEDIYKKFEASVHWKTMLDAKGGPETKGCESCHGPGLEHISSGGDKTKLFNFKTASATEISERCGTCHKFGSDQSNFGTSVHNLNDVSCASCHNIHKPKVAQKLLVNQQSQLCYTCHSDIRAQFNRPFRHRVKERLLECNDCHNPHGSFQTKQLRATASQDQVCFKCHADKAGPFVFEHAVVKTEGCMACHLPHGSSNPRLLRRAQVNLLCLECHTFASGTADPETPGVPSFHNQSQKYQACTLCHTAVHGSNFNQALFK